MRRNLLSVAPLAAVALTVTLTTPLSAQSMPASNLVDEVAAQLSTLNATLAEMQHLLEQQLETQTLDLILKRSQLASAEVGRLDGQLRRAIERRDGLEDERVRLEIRTENLEDFYRRGDEEGPSDEEIEMMRRNVRVSTAMVEDRLRDVTAEIIDLESRLERKREDLQSWQELLDRRLAGI